MEAKNEYLAKVAIGSVISASITYALGMSEGAILFGLYVLAIYLGYSDLNQTHK